MSLYHEIIKEYLGDGVRSTQYDLRVELPNIFQDDTDYSKRISVLCKSLTLPNISANPIDIRLRGQPIQVNGQSKYSNQWNCTFYCADDMKIRTVFEKWIENYNDRSNNGYTSFLGNTSSHKEVPNSQMYMNSIKIYVFPFTVNIGTDTDIEDALCEYELFNVFPIDISTLDFSSEGVGNILEFSVTFSYTYYRYRKL